MAANESMPYDKISPGMALVPLFSPLHIATDMLIYGNDACEKTLNTIELLEMILLFLPLKDLILTAGVCTTWRDISSESRSIRRALRFEDEQDGSLQSTDIAPMSLKNGLGNAVTRDHLAWFDGRHRIACNAAFGRHRCVC